MSSARRYKKTFSILICFAYFFSTQHIKPIEWGFLTVFVRRILGEFPRKKKSMNPLFLSRLIKSTFRFYLLFPSHLFNSGQLQRKYIKLMAFIVSTQSLIVPQKKTHTSKFSFLHRRIKVNLYGFFPSGFASCLSFIIAINTVLRWGFSYCIGFKAFTTFSVLCICARAQTDLNKGKPKRNESVEHITNFINSF